MTNNKKLIKALSLIFPFGIMFSSPVNAEIIRSNVDPFEQFGMHDPGCNTNPNVRCFGLPVYHRYYHQGTAEKCIREERGFCMEKTTISFYTNEENYIAAFAELTAIKKEFDSKYKSREDGRITGYTNCKLSTLTDPENGTNPWMTCDFTWTRDVYNEQTQVWTTQNGTGPVSLGNGFYLANYPKCLNSVNGYSYPVTYIEGFGCSGYLIRESSPTISECEKCDPKAAIDKLGSPIIPSYPSSNSKGRGGISVTTGEKFESKTDLDGPIKLTRLYSSKYNKNGTLGIGWRHNYDKKLILTKYKNIDTTIPDYIVTLQFILENNEDIFFQRSGPNEQFYPVFNNHKNYKLIIDNALNTYTLVGPNGIKETYNSDGQLIKITETNGEFKTLEYSNGRLVKIANQYNKGLFFYYIGDFIEKISSFGGSSDEILYTYQNNLLQSVKFKSEIIKYGYTNNLLSSITDPNGNMYAEFFYNSDDGKAIGSKNILNGNYTNSIDIIYGTDNISVNQDGTSSNFYIKNDEGINKISSANIAGLSQYNLSYGLGNTGAYIKDNAYTLFGYDTNNRLNKITKKSTGGDLYTSFVWNDNNQMISSSENSANGTRNVTLERDNNGNVTKKTISTPTGNRIFSYTYTTFGRPLTMTEPTGAVTTYTYYPANDSDFNRREKLATIKNALGHTITINSYNYNGKPTRITGANGVVKEIIYDDRNRIVLENIIGQNIYPLQTRYTYDLNGNLINVNSPDGAQVTYNYDQLNRLIGITDSLGNNKQITLDSKGNPISEHIYLNGQMMAVYNRSYDSINRITAMWRDDSSETESYAYDERGDISSSTNAINQTTSYVYDNLKRVTSSNANSKAKEFTYDNDNNITGISINYQKTAYTYNDFAELLTINSVDTGLTKFEYDIINRETKQTDNDGTQHTYKKDLLGRVTQITHTNPQATENFTYDTNSIGQLATVSDNSGTTSFNYDSLGRIIRKTQIVNGISKSLNYTYNDNGQLESITYPSGTTLTYFYVNEKLTYIFSSDGTLLISEPIFFPFTNNPISWTSPIGPVNKTYDLNGKLTSLSDGALFNKTINMNGIYNITQISDSGGYLNNYLNNTMSVNYNDNNQIINLNRNGDNKVFEFDTNMNLKKKTPYSFNYETNKIYSLVKDTGGFSYFFYDSRGNVKRNDRGDFTYDARNNLISSNVNGVYATYKFNAFNQRVAKTVGTDTTYFMYDGDKLIGEYDSAGNVIMEHIYMGNMPIGVFKDNQIHFVITDEMETPRAIVNQNGSEVWKWDNTDIYGSNEAVSNNNFTYNLRFAGQYFDNENGLHYNFNRTYDPQTGRYMQSDPIGLSGGDHTYNYVNGNPLNMTDTDGLMMRDSNGNLIFKPSYFTKNIFNESSKNIPGYIGFLFTDNGTPIEAAKYTGPSLNNEDYSADCHGWTFANGKYWIGYDQVDKLLENDNYKRIDITDLNQIQDGDALIYRVNDRPEHSLTARKTSQGMEAYGKGGTETKMSLKPILDGWSKKDSFYPDLPIMLEVYRK
jgi:RHS repeat-associated protein